MKKIVFNVVALTMVAMLATGCSSNDDDIIKEDTSSVVDKTDDLVEDFTDDLTDDFTINSDNMYQDGVYSAQTADEIDGYTHYVDITIKNNEISQVVFDGKDQNNNLKSQDENLKTKFEEEFSTYDYMDRYSKDLVEYQKTDEIDIIDGANTEHELFKKLADKALMKAQIGDTQLSILENDEIK